MESLHQQFGITIQSMTDVSQIFSVIGGWIEDLQIAMQYQKTNQTDISDANYRKVIYTFQSNCSLSPFTMKIADVETALTKYFFFFLATISSPERS